MFLRVVLSLFVSLVSISPIVALQTARAQGAEVELDQKCGEGYHPGFQTSSFQYELRPEVFINATSSFQHMEWYTGPIIATHGLDNTVGSTRTGNFSGIIFAERLVGYSRSPTKLDFQFESVTSIILPATPRPVALGYYGEELTVESICAGTATYVTFIAKYCARDVVGAYSLYSNYRSAATAGLAQKLGAEVFQGTCPGN